MPHLYVKSKKAEPIEIAKYVKRCSTSLATREMKIKTRMRYHYTAVSTAKIESSDYQIVERMHGN